MVSIVIFSRAVWKRSELVNIFLRNIDFHFFTLQKYSHFENCVKTGQIMNILCNYIQFNVKSILT